MERSAKHSEHFPLPTRLIIFVSGRKLGGSLPESFVFHPPTTHHIAVCEGNRIEIHQLTKVFVPDEAFMSQVHQFPTWWSSGLCKGLQGCRDFPVISASLRKGDRVLESRSRPGPDGEMNGSERITDEYDVAAKPLLILHYGEVQP